MRYLQNSLLAGIVVSAACLFTTNASAQLSSNPDKFLGNITTRYQVDYGNEPFHTLWNQITPENESKWGSIEGNARGQFNWGCDNSYNYAKQHNFPFKFHCLIWGAQYPNWLNNLSPEQQYEAIVEWMDAVKERYPDLPLIDVVNEAVAGHQPAPYKEALGGDGKTGYDWIIKAFELAHERWPDAILIYNDYNTFQWQRAQFIDLVRTMRDYGAPVDAYGCQSHDLTDMNLNDFKNAMTEIQDALKMPMYSTEYDIGTTDDQLQLQRYQEQIPYMWESDYCAGITLWGYIYGATWTTDGNSGIIRDGKDRPAMTWLREYMQTDAAKNARSPYPGMKKEASVYVKCSPVKVTVDEEVAVTINARLKTKTIDHIDLYVDGNLQCTMNQEPFATSFVPTTSGRHDVKAVVVATDGSEYERYSGVRAYSPRAPFKGAIELPGTLEGENFDSGAEGMTYHDSDNQNEGTSAYRNDSEGVDIVTGNGGYAIGYTSSGEWLEYTVDVKEAGVYEYDAIVSSGVNNSSFSLSLNENDELTPLTNNIVVPCLQSNNWDTYSTLHGRLLVPLEAGLHIFRINITGSSCNIDKLVFKHVEVDENIDITVTANPDPAVLGEETTLSITASSPTGTIDKVILYRNDVLFKTLDSQPFDYTFTPTTKGNFKYSAVAVDNEGRLSKVADYVLMVNNRRIPYNALACFPGIIEAEDFDKGGEGFTFHDSDAEDEGNVHYRNDNEGVDIVTGNNGYALGYTANGEWTEYTVTVNKTGRYAFEGTASSGLTNSGFSLGLLKNGTVNTLCQFNVPQTGNSSWDTYRVVAGSAEAVLDAGTHVFRLTITGPYCNIDKVEAILVEDLGIEDVADGSQRASGDTYNLYGVKVNGNYKGVVIKNGKKFINR